MKERPILFSAPMVRGILEDRKTQTRRIVKPCPASVPGDYFKDMGDARWQMFNLVGDPLTSTYIPCPVGQPGDRLWVRENFHPVYAQDPTYNKGEPIEIDYAATYEYGNRLITPKWTPSIHMPRWASRITLEVIGVRVERLQDISEADAIAEGIERVGDGWQRFHVCPDAPIGQPFTRNPVLAYRGLWESINGPGSWDVNPWVWVVEFRKVMP